DRYRHAGGAFTCSFESSRRLFRRRRQCRWVVSIDVSVIVCAHDEARWEELKSALDSLEQQSLRPHEVIVVVDHNDALLHRVRESLEVVAIANTQTRGLGGARNSGVAAS